MFGLSKMVSPFLFGQHLRLATRFFFSIIIISISISIILEDSNSSNCHQELPEICPSQSAPFADHCRVGHHCGQVDCLDKLSNEYHDHTGHFTCRAVSEMREGLSEGNGGFDLVLANKKEKVQ